MSATKKKKQAETDVARVVCDWVRSLVHDAEELNEKLAEFYRVHKPQCQCAGCRHIREDNKNWLPDPLDALHALHMTLWGLQSCFDDGVLSMDPARRPAGCLKGTGLK